MKAVAMEPLTVEDYRLLPDAGPRYQLIEGEADTFTSPHFPGLKIKGATVFKR